MDNSFTLWLVGDERGQQDGLIESAHNGSDAYAAYLMEQKEISLPEANTAWLLLALKDEDDPASDLIHNTIHILGGEEYCFCNLGKKDTYPSRSTWV